MFPYYYMHFKCISAFIYLSTSALENVISVDGPYQLLKKDWLKGLIVSVLLVMFWFTALNQLQVRIY